MRDGAHASAGTMSPETDGKRYCARCSPGLFRRINRVTLIERTLMTWLGFYPWECVNCRKKRFFRDAGRKPRTQVRPQQG